MFFDFVYHKDYYDQVCGAGSIHQLATDPIEQEIVRQHYAGFISHHSHKQMMNWHQRFSGMNELSGRLALMEKELRILKAERVEEEEKHPGPDRVRGLVIPEIARGYEDIYQRFLKGVLVYRPTEGSDVGKIEMPIAALANPLEGSFDLSLCGDAGQHLSIATGYRKAKNPLNSSKVEIWLTPRFLIEKELATTAKHYTPIIGSWANATAPVGMFFNWGNWDDLGWFDYLTSMQIEQIDNQNLLNLHAHHIGATRTQSTGTPPAGSASHPSRTPQYGHKSRTASNRHAYATISCTGALQFSCFVCELK